MLPKKELSEPIVARCLSVKYSCLRDLEATSPKPYDNEFREIKIGETKVSEWNCMFQKTKSFIYPEKWLDF